MMEHRRVIHRRAWKDAEDSLLSESSLPHFTPSAAFPSLWCITPANGTPQSMKRRRRFFAFGTKSSPFYALFGFPISAVHHSREWDTAQHGKTQRILCFRNQVFPILRPPCGFPISAVHHSREWDTAEHGKTQRILCFRNQVFPILPPLRLSHLCGASLPRMGHRRAWKDAEMMNDEVSNPTPTLCVTIVFAVYRCITSPQHKHEIQK